MALTRFLLVSLDQQCQIQLTSLKRFVLSLVRHQGNIRQVEYSQGSECISVLHSLLRQYHHCETVSQAAINVVRHL